MDQSIAASEVLMQTSDPILRTKLRPPSIRQNLVNRPHLQAQIQQGLSAPLTLITAPPGFGKTTLVASVVSGCQLPVAWLSVDKNDNQVGRFLRYLVAAMQETEIVIGKEAAHILTAAPDAAPEAVLTNLINSLDAAGGEMILVLDDYQLITNPAVHECVAFLLNHCPGNFHLVINSRSDPPLPLSRLRARGHVVELRTSDLRFTVNEAVQFLNAIMDLNLCEKAVAALEERTEGWIAGLQMAALSMRGRQDIDNFIREFTGTNRYIMDFMLEEVLAREPEAVQAFLLQTSILHRLTGPLCDTVTGLNGSQMMLEQLERRNLFLVPLDDERRWYRYHNLFADLLQARLHQLGAEKTAHLFTRAAEWCEHERLVTEAVSYAFAAQNDRFAARLIEQYWQQMANNGEIETVFSWLNTLPADLLKKNASLNAAYCVVLWLMGKVDAIEAHVEDAERALALQDDASQAGEADNRSELPVILAAMRSFVARYHQQYALAVALADRALHLITENQPENEIEELRTLAFLALGSAYDGLGDLEKAVSSYAEVIRGSKLTGNATGVAGITYRMAGALRILGRLRDADAACREALNFFEVQGMNRLPAVGILHVAMSEVLVERNDLKAAETRLAQGIELGKWSGRLNAATNAVSALTRLRMARQDPAGALMAIREVEKDLVLPVSALLKAELLAFKARIMVRQGAVSDAAQCVEEANRLVGREQGQTRSIVDLAANRVFAAQYPPVEAITRLSQALDMAEARGQMGMALELRLLRSLVLARQGKIQEAEVDLERALMLAEQEGYIRIFLDEGQPMQQLLAQWHARAKTDPSSDYATRLLHQLNENIRSDPDDLKTPSSTGSLLKPEDRIKNTLLVEPISARELEVLQLMAVGCTNDAIAQQLVVARGTIKAHAASIYRKLDVANRTEAVARARHLGILP